MSKWRRILAFIISVSLLVSVGWVAPTGAEDNQVTIGVGDTTLFVSGLTSPLAFVTILDNHSVIGTTTAAIDGSYSKDFSAFAPGIHQLSVYARDSAGRLTDTVELEVSVAEHFQTNVGLFLPPTLSIENPTVRRGERVRLLGSTLPNGNITITLDNNTNFQVQANSGGDWFYELNTTPLSIGSHSLFAVASEVTSGSHSYPSAKRTITVEAEPIVSPPSIVPPVLRPPPPVILHPSPGSTITDNQLIVRGTAQPGTQIELFNGERSVGSTFADRNGRWQILLTLTELEYLLRAKACRQTLCSEFSEAVRFFYRPAPGVGDFTARLEQFRYTSRVGKPIGLRLHISGGRPPYRLTLTWNDGRQETVSTNQTELTLGHTYNKAGAYIGRVTVEDQEGRSVNLGFSVLVMGGLDFLILWQLLLLLVFLVLLLIGFFHLRYYHHKKSNRQRKAKR